MMPEINWMAIIVAGLVPSALGALYYGPLLGTTWLDSLGATQEDVEPSNPALTYGASLLLSMLLASSLAMTIALVHKDMVDGQLVFGSFQTFKHGALHGAMMALTIVVPVITSLSLFQGNSWKNIGINVVFWTVCMAIMGGILDAWQ